MKTSSQYPRGVKDRPIQPSLLKRVLTPFPPVSPDQTIRPESIRKTLRIDSVQAMAFTPVLKGIADFSRQHSICLVSSGASHRLREHFLNQPMTITITLPPAIEERLRAQAEATGKNISTLVVEAVEARLSLAHLRLRDILAPVHADLHGSGMTDVELDTLLQGALDESRSARSPSSGSPV